MRIAIIGGGAIGLLFGYYLARSSGELTLYVRRREQAEELEQTGLHLVSGKRLEKAVVKAQVLNEAEGIDADLVVVAAKQYDLPALMERLAEKVSIRSKLLFVQNGMSHLSLLKALPHKEIYVGIVEHGALKLADNKVEHTGEGITKLAAFRGVLDRTCNLWNTVASERFPVEFCEEWYEMMAEKLLVNAVINPLTALYRVKNGELALEEAFVRNMRRLFDEAFDTLGLKEASTHWGKVLEVCRKTASNRSSMLRDVEMGRETEIDAICGYLLDRATESNRSLPFTQFVYDSIVGLSHKRTK